MDDVVEKKECPAALNLEGGHYPCDWPTDDDGKHSGWAHTNKEVQAQWKGDEEI